MAAKRWIAGATAVAALGLLVGAVTFSAPQVEARGRLRARVMMTQARVPRKLSERGLVRFMRKHGTKRLVETKEDKLKDRAWKANLLVQFNRAPGDLEFHVLFYDIHEGSRKFVEDLSTFVSDRDQSSFLQKLKLPRPRFKPNRRMELVVTVRRQKVARHKFIVVGEEKRNTGRVDFSDDET